MFGKRLFIRRSGRYYGSLFPSRLNQFDKPDDINVRVVTKLLEADCYCYVARISHLSENSLERILSPPSHMPSRYYI